MIAKPKRWRCGKYLSWVRSQPCALCGAPADHAHHIIGVGGLGGMGLKAPDSYAMPLCASDHYKVHAHPELLPRQWEWVARTLAAAIDAGVITIRGAK